MSGQPPSKKQRLSKSSLALPHMPKSCQARVSFSSAERASFKSVLQPSTNYLELVSCLFPVEDTGDDILRASSLVVSQMEPSQATHWHISASCTVEIRKEHSLKRRGEYVEMILDSTALCSVLQITAAPFLVLECYNGRNIKASLLNRPDGDASIIYDLQLKSTDCETLVTDPMGDDVYVIHCEIPPNYFSSIFDKRDSEIMRFFACAEDNSLVVHIITGKQGHSDQVYARYGCKMNTIDSMRVLSNRLEDLPEKLKCHPDKMSASIKEAVKKVDTEFDFDTVSRVMRDLHASSNTVRLSLTTEQFMRMRIDHKKGFVEVVFANRVIADE